MIGRLSTLTVQSTDPFRNLAVEQTLLRGVRQGECILYLWQNRNTVVIGRNQNAWDECRAEQLAADGGLLARRMSGGGAVFHDLGNLNFTFVVAEPDYDVAKQTSVLLRAVRALGVEAELTGRNDLTAGGQKFSGHAYYKSRGACLHHGTLMVDVDGEKLARYLQVPAQKLAKNGVASVRSRVVNLAALCPGLTVQALSEKILYSFGEVYGLTPQPLTEAALDGAAIAENEAKFASWDWRFGARVRFVQQLRGAFSWGSVTLGYTVKEGRLRDVRLYSDGLQAELLAAVPALLEGRRYAADDVAQALAGQEAYHPICEDIAGLFRTAF